MNTRTNKTRNQPQGWFLLFFAAVMILNKFIKGVTGIHRTFIQFLAAVIVLVPYVLCTDGFNLNSLNVSGWGALLILGLVHTGITYCMYFSALKELSGQKVAILSYIDPLVAVIVSLLWLQEPYLRLKLSAA